jgi:hypothetical protein
MRCVGTLPIAERVGTWPNTNEMLTGLAYQVNTFVVGFVVGGHGFPRVAGRTWDGAVAGLGGECCEFAGWRRGGRDGGDSRVGRMMLPDRDDRSTSGVMPSRCEASSRRQEGKVPRGERGERGDRGEPRSEPNSGEGAESRGASRTALRAKRHHFPSPRLSAPSPRSPRGTLSLLALSQTASGRRRSPQSPVARLRNDMLCRGFKRAGVTSSHDGVRKGATRGSAPVGRVACQAPRPRA